MNAIEETDFMGRLRGANPELAHLSSVQLLDRAAEDTEEVGALADALRIENPDHAHLSPGRLIGLAIKQNPDAFKAAAPEWQPFAAEHGSLGIPRASMPQIRSEHRGAMVQYLKGRGITHSLEDVAPNTLKPSQAEFSPEKVDKARSFEGESRRILISSDNHVVDGHHQWMKDFEDAPAVPTHGRQPRRQPTVRDTHTPQGTWKAALDKAEFQRRSAEVPAVSVNTGQPERNFMSAPLRRTSAAEVNTLVNNEGSDANDARKVYGQSMGQVASDAVNEPPRPVNTMSAVSPAEHEAGLQRRAAVDARDAEIESLIRQNVEDEAAAEVGMSRTVAARNGQSDVFDFHVNQLTKARMNTLQAALAGRPELRTRTPQELANMARDASDLEGDGTLARNIRQGAWSAAAGVKHDVGNLVDVISLGSFGEGMPGFEKLKPFRDALHDAARRDQDTVQLSRSIHPDEEGNLNEVSRAVGGMAVELPKLYLTSPLGAAQLPVLGAVSSEHGIHNKGAIETLDLMPSLNEFAYEQKIYNCFLESTLDWRY